MRTLLLVSFAAIAVPAQSDPVRRPDILVCIADDWSWPHASVAGEPVVATPNFDAIAREGVLFSHAFCAAPSCTPSRAAILSGQAPHRLREGATLHGLLPNDVAVYPDLLEAVGYRVGFTRKGWGPGRTKEAGRERNPAGPRFEDFGKFLDGQPDDEPFCFWWGSQDPHRGYRPGSGRGAGLDPDAVRVPGYLPDRPEVRSDLCDYYFEVMRFDRQLGELLALLERHGRGDAIVVVTSDNGMPFPRAKATVYDGGTRVPLAIRGAVIGEPGRTVDGFVGLADLAPTFLELAGVAIPEAMTGRSLVPLLSDPEATGRDAIQLERERHAHVREGNLGYPVRAWRTRRWLYIENFAPDRWPSGDPEHVFSVGPFGDVDASPTKALIVDGRDDAEIAPFFDLAFAKRPARELYDLERDPEQLRDVAGEPELAEVEAELARALRAALAASGDPRAEPTEADPFDSNPYFGGRARRR